MTEIEPISDADLAAICSALDGLPETSDRPYRGMIARIRHLEAQLAALQAERETMIAGIKEADALMRESAGVGGLHLNGDFATWDELRTGGSHEGWLAEFDAACALLDEPLPSLPTEETDPNG